MTAPGAPADDTVVVHTHPDYPDLLAEGYPVREDGGLSGFGDGHNRTNRSSPCRPRCGGQDCS